MNRIIVILALSLFIFACSDDKTPTQPIKNVESMYSWLNINGNTKWNYDKKSHIRGKDWIDEEPEYGNYLITSDTSSIFKLQKMSDGTSTFQIDLSYDSTKAYMNSFLLGNEFVDPVLKKLDFKRLKIADMNEKEWDLDTLFYNDIVVDDKNTLYGFIAFKANRLEDSTVVYNGSEKVLKRFQLTIRVIINQVENNYYFTIYPAYSFSLIDGVGFYQIRLWNHTNTAIAIQEFEYNLKNTTEGNKTK
ncbi:hypothetical protein EP342_01550 [bacterium]|nr:MAG: hypothetical protein EP342_01550 [bacterium]